MAAITSISSAMVASILMGVDSFPPEPDPAAQAAITALIVTRFDKKRKGNMNIKAFWKDVIEQNRSALVSYFSENAVIRWHCTNEEFTVAEYIRANCDYPGKWYGSLERIEKAGSTMILVGKVRSADDTVACHVTSFIKLQNDKICEMDEYWADDGEPPAWRKELGIGRDIIRR